MSSEKMILSNGKIIYPCYLTREDRMSLLSFLSENNETMWCGCRTDKKLYYKISRDLRIIPAHHDYIHADTCARNSGVRKYGYVTGDDGSCNVYLTFNPKNMPIIKKKEEEISKEADTKDNSVSSEQTVDAKTPESKEKEEKPEKDKRANLADLVRQLNYDTFLFRQQQGKNHILSAEYFLYAVMGRAKNVYLGASDKSLRDYTLEQDKCFFFYAPLHQIIKEKVYTLRTHIKKADGTYITPSYFVPDGVMEQALEDYKKQYEHEYANTDKNVMAAGFIYQKISKRTGNPYKAVGRLHLFRISKNGIYMNNDAEEVLFDTVLEQMRKKDDITLILPKETEKWSMQVLKPNRKTVYVYANRRERGMEKATNHYVCYEGKMDPDIEELASLLKEL